MLCEKVLTAFMNKNDLNQPEQSFSFLHIPSVNPDMSNRFYTGIFIPG